MAQKTCSACGGTYEPQQGLVSYFHACAPVRNPTTGAEEPRAGHRNENRPPEPRPRVEVKPHKE